MRRIYADNAATTQISTSAFNVMSKYLLQEFGNASQPYTFARVPKKALYDVRALIANCIGSSPEEIFFTSSGTESDNWVISSFKDKGITTTPIEHHAILKPCEVIAKAGTSIQYLTIDKYGLVSPESLENTFCDSGSLVSIMFANNEIGTMQDIRSLASIAHSKDCYFHTDAVQAVGHVQINVDELGVDYLSASAHKFNGPKGVGFLYVRKGSPLKPIIMGGSQEFAMRAGTENIASIVAMATALKENVENLQGNASYIQKLESVLLDSLSSFSLDYIRNGINQIPGNLSLSFKGANGEMLLHRLDLMGICVSTGSACDSQNTQVSHVLKAISLDRDYAEGTIRVSLGKDNTMDDVLEIASAIKKILKQ